MVLAIPLSSSSDVHAAWCRLTAFVLAREEPAEACRLTPLSSGSALGPCMYDKGVSQAEMLHCTLLGGTLKLSACLANFLQEWVVQPQQRTAPACSSTTPSPGKEPQMQSRSSWT